MVHVGDTFWNGIYPFIDYSTGGSIDGMIAACDANLAAATDDTIIIPGHGKPSATRPSSRNFATCSSRSAKMSPRSRSRDAREPRRSRRKPTAAFDAKFGNFVIDPGFFTRLVYEGV